MGEFSGLLHCLLHLIGSAHLTSCLPIRLGTNDAKREWFDRNFGSSRHPRDIEFLTVAICDYAWRGDKQSTLIKEKQP